MRPRVGCRLRPTVSLLAAAIAAMLLATAAPASAQDCANADAQPGQVSNDQLAAATLCLLNQQRAAFGLQQLRPLAPLTDTAQKYAAYMVSDAHFAHQDESGHNVVWRVLQTDPSLANRWDVFGENLGWGTYGLATPRAMVTGWMNSPEHRANILFPRYDLIGVGVAAGAPVPGKTDALTYTTVFAKLRTLKPRMHAASCRAAKRARTRAARARAKRACVARARSAGRH